MAFYMHNSLHFFTTHNKILESMKNCFFLQLIHNWWTIQFNDNEILIYDTNTP